MSYPVGTPVHTFLLADGMSADCDPVVVCYRHADGEVTVMEYADYRAAQSACERAIDNGSRVLAVVEGGTDLGYGTSSVWVRR